MRKLLLLVVLALWPTVASAQIAYDSYGSADVAFSCGNRTWSHTTSGSNRILFVGSFIADTCTVTGITYNGVPLTLIASQSSGSGDDFTAYLWYLIAPDTGTHDITITMSGSGAARWDGSVSYTGVAQTSPIDTFVTKQVLTSSASITTNFTTTTDNAWSVIVSRSNQLPNEGTGSHEITGNLESIYGYSMYDSGAALTPAGAKSMQITYSTNATNFGGVLAAFCPATTGCTAGGGGSSVKMLLTLGIGY